MLTEFTLLLNILEDLVDNRRMTGINKVTDRVFHRDERGRKVLLDRNAYVDSYLSDKDVVYYSDIIDDEWSKYQTTIEAKPLGELRRTQGAREAELAYFYQRWLGLRHNLDGEVPLDADTFRLLALKDLSIGFIVISYWVYKDKGLDEFMPSFFKNLTEDERDEFIFFAREKGDTESTFDGNDLAPAVDEQPVQVKQEENVKQARSTMQKGKEYNLLIDYPQAAQILDNFVPNYLNTDYSLKGSTSKAKASVIAYAVAELVGINEKAKYFENFWEVSNLKNAFSATQPDLRIKIIQIACLESRDIYGGEKVVNPEKESMLKEKLRKQI